MSLGIVSSLVDLTVISMFSLSLAFTGVALKAAVTDNSSCKGLVCLRLSPERLNSANCVSFLGGTRA
jgi:hypothetical protein